MTIADASNVTSFTGNSSTIAYNTSFVFFNASDIKVYVSQVLQVQNTDYTVSGGNGSTGTITFGIPPITGAQIIIQRLVPYSQESDFAQYDGFPPAVVERQFDLLTMQAQQLNNELSRAVLVPIGSSGFSTLLPTPEANKAIICNSTGTGLIYSTLEIDTHTATAQANSQQTAVILQSMEATLVDAQDSLQVAEANAASAANSATIAQQNASDLTFPTLQPGDQDKMPVVNAAATGYDLVTRVQFLDGATTGSQGDILYRTSTDWVQLPIGAAGKFLRVVSGLPAWSDMPAATTTVGGGVQLATAADLQAGSSASLAITPAVLSEATGLCSRYEQAVVSLVAGSLTNITVSASPWTTEFIVAWLVCTSSDQGYSVGDQLYMNGFGGAGGVTGISAAVGSVFAAYPTTYGVSIRQSTGGIRVNHKSTGVSGAINFNNWTVRFIVYGHNT